MSCTHCTVCEASTVIHVHKRPSRHATWKPALKGGPSFNSPGQLGSNCMLQQLRIGTANDMASMSINYIP